MNPVLIAFITSWMTVCAVIAVGDKDIKKCVFCCLTAGLGILILVYSL